MTEEVDAKVAMPKHTDLSHFLPVTVGNGKCTACVCNNSSSHLQVPRQCADTILHRHTLQRQVFGEGFLQSTQPKRLVHTIQRFGTSRDGKGAESFLRRGGKCIMQINTDDKCSLDDWNVKPAFSIEGACVRLKLRVKEWSHHAGSC